MSYIFMNMSLSFRRKCVTLGSTTGKEVYDRD